MEETISKDKKKKKDKGDKSERSEPEEKKKKKDKSEKSDMSESESDAEESGKKDKKKKKKESVAECEFCILSFSVSSCIQQRNANLPSISCTIAFGLCLHRPVWLIWPFCNVCGEEGSALADISSMESYHTVSALLTEFYHVICMTSQNLKA